MLYSLRLESLVPRCFINILLLDQSTSLSKHFAPSESFTMTRYSSAEIDGNAANSAQLIAELRGGHEELLVDRRGFLLIPEQEWEAVERLADQHHCALRPIEKSREAA